MVNATHQRFNASDRSYFAIIKKEIHTIALRHEMPAKRIAELDIVVAELTSNLNKHATEGEILVGWFDDKQASYLEIISIDRGPGIHDVQRVIADGYSTSNTLGHGLGSIKRLADEFDMYSLKGWGTIALARIYRKGGPVRKSLRTLKAYPVIISHPQEMLSGDGFVDKSGEKLTKLMLMDGLGHGAEANRAINVAAEAFNQCPFTSPVEILRFLHREVRKTRGLVGLIAVANKAERSLLLAGIGNISAKLFGPAGAVKSVLSYNGIIGHNIPNTMNDVHVPHGQFQELILCSDGLRSRWEMGKYVGIYRCDPSIKAAALYKDFGRTTDDMSAVIIKL